MTRTAHMIKPIIASSAVMVATAGAGLIEEHSIHLKTVVSLGLVALAWTWWLSCKFTNIDDRMKSLEKSLDSVKKHLDI